MKLKLGPIADDKPVKVAVELPATLHRDLVAYAEALARETGRPIADPVRLIIPMQERYIATGRGFAKTKRGQTRPAEGRSRRSDGRHFSYRSFLRGSGAGEARDCRYGATRRLRSGVLLWVCDDTKYPGCAILSRSP